MYLHKTHRITLYSIDIDEFDAAQLTIFNLCVPNLDGCLAAVVVTRVLCFWEIERRMGQKRNILWTDNNFRGIKIEYWMDDGDNVEQFHLIFV